MLLKIPSNSDWTDQYQQYSIEESDIELDEETDFAEYLWMENEEEFDATELQRLQDEELMKDCIDSMLDDEIEAKINEWKKLKTEDPLTVVTENDVDISLLNPLATEFIPESQNGHIIRASMQQALTV